MPRYTSKFGIGDKVEVRGISGVVTAVHIRQRHRAYEFSYSHDGVPCAYVCEEVELKLLDKGKVGFHNG